jgi:uracil-DNA glycosylase
MREHYDWIQWINAEMEKSYVQQIIAEAERRNKKALLSPDPDHWFDCLRFPDYRKIHTIIVGNAPYHYTYAADGLAFSSCDDVDYETARLHAKISADLGIEYDTSDCTKQRWLEQGILCFPLSFTATNGKAYRYDPLWHPLTENILNYFITDEQIRAFLFFDFTTSYRMPRLFVNKLHQDHLIIQKDIRTPEFMKGDIFNTVNDFIYKCYKKEVDWR